jgi:hypothetical protein
MKLLKTLLSTGAISALSFGMVTAPFNYSE